MPNCTTRLLFFGKFFHHPRVNDYALVIIPLPNSYLLVRPIQFLLHSDLVGLIVIIGVEDIVGIPYVPLLVKFLYLHIILA